MSSITTGIWRFDSYYSPSNTSIPTQSHNRFSPTYHLRDYQSAKQLYPVPLDSSDYRHRYGMEDIQDHRPCTGTRKGQAGLIVIDAFVADICVMGRTRYSSMLSYLLSAASRENNRAAILATVSPPMMVESALLPCCKGFDHPPSLVRAVRG
jgi:hypothetical protein